jgi:hypothetical protein
MKYCILIIMLLLLAGCGDDSLGQSEKKAGERPQADMADTSSAPAENSDASTSAAMRPGSGSVATDIAYGVAPYPDARQLGVSPDFFLQKGTNPMWFQYETADAPTKVITFYKAEAEKAGFELKKETDRKLARSMTIETTRPGGAVMNVDTLAQADGNTMINLHISEDD